MTDKKFVPFDYQRYLDGDKVFTKYGYEVKQLTRFTDLPDVPSLGESHCMVGSVGTRIIMSDARGFFQGHPELFMLQKPKKLWIAILKHDLNTLPGSFMKKFRVTSRAVYSKDDLFNLGFNEKDYHFVEIEIEE